MLHFPVKPRRLFSPPPCGEGSGMGVDEWGTLSATLPDPPPRPSPARGEGEGRGEVTMIPALVAMAVLLNGCTAFDRLINIGEQPKLSAIDNPTTKAGY